MKVYDEEIAKIKAQCQNGTLLLTDRAWESEKKEELLLRMDAALELGGSGLPAVGALGFTTDASLVEETKHTLIGAELAACSMDQPYARITLLRLNEEMIQKAEEEKSLYLLLRDMEYVRYRLHLKGCLLRVSSAKEREVLRISKQAVADGISFAGIAKAYEAAYRSFPQVEAVQTIFVTDPAFSYDKLRTSARRMEQITQSFEHIYESLTMDCSQCGSKAVCDEIEGLRALHFAQVKKGGSGA